MKNIATILFLTILTCFNVYSFSGAGSGTDGDPYLISTVEQLQEINYELDAHYILTKDIDASNTKEWNIADHDNDIHTEDEPMGFKPIGYYSEKINSEMFFTGSFDGRGHKIKNLYINKVKDNYVALFGLNSGTIKNLVLWECTVYGNEYVGSIAGYNKNSTIIESYATGYVKGKVYVGGLVGYNEGRVIATHTNTLVMSGHSYAGGLVGYNMGYILNSYATGEIVGVSIVGGLVGSNKKYIKNTYSNGNVSGNVYVGGLIGQNYSGDVINSYTSGFVIGEQITGGLIGSDDYGNIEGCFWDKEECGQSESDEGIGKSSSELQRMDTYSEYDWNFSLIWKIDDGYPYIDIDRSNCPLDTDGDGRLNIGNLQELSWISESGCCMGSDLELDNDINAAETRNWNNGEGFRPIGYEYSISFTGSFDGNFHVIDSLYINLPDKNNIGLFATINDKQGVIQNLGLENCYISGCSRVGSITAQIFMGTVKNSYAKGTVIGSSYVGGIVGQSYNGILVDLYFEGSSNDCYFGGLVGHSSGFVSNSSAEITVTNCKGTGGLIYSNSGILMNSYSKGTINSGGKSGGIVGINEGYILNSYSLADLSGDGKTGGISGSNYYMIYNSFFAGKISACSNSSGICEVNEGTINNCFWDKDINDSIRSDKYARTSAEMKSFAIYNSAGWNFDFIWKIDDSYPYIQIDEAFRPVDKDKDGKLNILSANDLYWLSESGYGTDENWELSADIDVSMTEDLNDGKGFFPIPYFTGSFDGKDFTVSNLYIDRPDENNLGLFGISYSEEISCLRLKKVDIMGNENAGMLAGYNLGGKLKNCYADGIIQGKYYIGGLVGYNAGDIELCNTDGLIAGERSIGGLVGHHYSDSISRSYTHCIVSGYSSVGGFVGSNSSIGIICDCYSRSNVSGTDNAGGFAGSAYNIVINSYSTGKVLQASVKGGFVAVYDYGEELTNCAWDMESSCLDVSASGIGMTTTQMKTITEFTDMGWDFTDTWDIDPWINNGYPYLRNNIIEVSVEDNLSLNNPQIKIFPNPATDNINIILPKEAQINYIRISDISGREVKSESVNSYTDKISMNISDLLRGFYIINLYSGGAVYSCAVVVD